MDSIPSPISGIPSPFGARRDAAKLSDYYAIEDGVAYVPTLVYDRANKFSGSRDLEESDYNVIEDGEALAPSLIYDRQNGFSGSRGLSAGDYRADGYEPVLIYDRQNSFGGSQ